MDESLVLGPVGKHPVARLIWNVQENNSNFRHPHFEKERRFQLFSPMSVVKVTVATVTRIFHA